jgi:ABC-type Co2+ transport system permease subunit
VGNVAIFAAAYAALLYYGLRSIRKNGRKQEMIWYVALVGWCVYMNVAKMLHLPGGSVAQLHHFFFSPIGEWLKYVLGVSS